MEDAERVEMNVELFTGRLTKEPESRYAGETQIVTFTLAVDREGKDAGADFIRFKCFGKNAENAEKWLTKGRLIELRSHVNTWKAEKDGETKFGEDHIVDRWRFLGAKPEEKPAEEQHFAALDEDDSIPF